MKESVMELPCKLDTEISEFSSNVSERWLLCLARVLLLGNNILMIDEPTADMDHE